MQLVKQNFVGFALFYGKIIFKIIINVIIYQIKETIKLKHNMNMNMTNFILKDIKFSKISNKDAKMNLFNKWKNLS